MSSIIPKNRVIIRFSESSVRAAVIMIFCSTGLSFETKIAIYCARVPVLYVSVKALVMVSGH